MSTLASVAEALPIRRNTPSISGEVPMMPKLSGGVSGEASTRRRCNRSTIRDTEVSSSSVVKGLARYSPAPSLMASTAPGMDG